MPLSAINPGCYQLLLDAKVARVSALLAPCTPPAFAVYPSGTAIPMGFVRMGTGRDAADVSFATIFGGVQSLPPLIQVNAVDDGSGQFTLPQHTALALSTDPGP